MKPVTRVGDIHSGHQCFPPTKGSSGSPNVFANGRAVMRLGDNFKPHGCPKPHSVIASTGYGKVLVNGKAIVRVSSKTACTATVVMGSPNVVVGG